jgi:hypothetical protein
MEFLNRINKIQTVTFFILLILLSYILQIYIYNLNFFYLSFSYNTDPIYNFYLNNIEEQLFKKKLNFPWYSIYFHYFFLKLFTFKFFFISAIILKILFFSLLCFYFNKFFYLDKKNFFIITLVIFILFMTNYGIFHDRFPRPQITNIYFCISFFYLYAVSFSKKISKIEIIILGIFSCLLFFENIWSFVFLIPFFIFAFIKMKKKINIFYFFFSGIVLSLIHLDTVISTLLSTPERFLILGTKEIYDLKKFIFDYYDQIFLSKKNILFYLIILFNCFYVKNFKLFLFAIFSVVLSILPMAIFGRTIQSYHFVISSHEILLYLAICSMTLTLENFNLNKKCLFIVNFLFIFILFIGIYNSNNWALRSKLIEKFYSDIFQKVENIPSNCIIVTNDLYLKSYAQLITKHKVFPEELVITNNYNNNVLKEISEQYFKTKLILDKNNITYENFHLVKLIVLISHNFFESTRSTSNVIILDEFNKEIDGLKNIMSLSPWNDTMIKIILEKNLLKNDQKNTSNLDRNYFLIFNLKKNRYLSKNDFQLVDRCSK